MTQTLTELTISTITQKQETKLDFKTILTQSIDETLSILGNDIKQVFYSHLKNSFGLKKEDVYLNIETFTTAIETMFGKSSLLLEIKIMSSLHEKVENFNFECSKGEVYFTDYLATLQTFVEWQNIAICKA
jgi:hypothetical protein